MIQQKLIITIILILMIKYHQANEMQKITSETKDLMRKFQIKQDVEEEDEEETKNALPSYDLNLATENDQDMRCKSECQNGGQCQFGLCFCLSPYFGPFCDSRLFIRTTVSQKMSYFILSLSLITGFLLAYFLKLVFDIIKDPVQNNNEENFKQVWIKS